MNIEGSVVLVTGANRGIGEEFVRGLRAAGAAKVYAGARAPQAITPADSVVPIALDVTDQDQVAAAARQASDVQIVINNAGIAASQSLIGGDTDKMHEEFEVNVFGPLYIARAFAPVLKANGGGTIANALSAVSWFSFPGQASYSATKAAAWNMTDALRLELAGQGTTVLAFHMGPVRTELGDSFGIPDDGPIRKNSTEEVVTAVIGAIEAGASELLIDDISHVVRSTVNSDPSRYTAILGG